jgi:hypothetical protein
MKTVAAATRFQIHQGQGQVIVPKEPFGRPRRIGLPFNIPIRAPRREAG